MKCFASYFLRFRSLPLTSLVFALYLFSFYFIPLTTHAYFQAWGLSARGASWGGAGSAWGVGVLDYLTVNPAAMGAVRSLRMEGEYAAWGHGWNDGSSLAENGLRLGVPLAQGTFAASWHTRGLQELLWEEQLGAAFAWPTGWEGVEFLGVGVKAYHVGYQDVWAVRSNAGFAALDARAVSWDLGLRGWLMSGWSYAVGLGDLGQPSLSVTGEEVRQPAVVRLGLGWQVGPGWRIGMDPEWRGPGGSFRGGVEFLAPDRSFSVRTGGVASWGSGLPVQAVSWHAGGSAQVDVGWGQVILHYGWTYPLTGLGGWGVHRFGISVREAEPSVVVSSPLAVTLAGRVGALPDPPWFFSVLRTPQEEWVLGESGATGTDPARRHRHAALTVLVAGVTAGERTYRALVGLSATPFDQAALRTIRNLRYQAEGGALTGVVDAYREAALLPNAPPDVHLVLGYALALRKEWSASLQAYRRWWGAAQRDQGDVGAAYTMATVALKVRDLAAAESGLSALKAAGAAETWIRELQGRVFLARGRVEEALEKFQEQERAAGTAEERARAKCHQAAAWSSLPQADALERAMSLLQEAEAMAGGGWVADTRQALIGEVVKNGMEEGRIDEERLLMKEALNAYERVLRWKPDHLPAVERVGRVKEKIQDQVQVHARRAHELMEARDLGRAIGEWKLVLDADAFHQEARDQVKAIFEALVVKANARIQEGAYGEAMRIFQWLEEARPGDPVVSQGRDDVRALFTAKAKRHEAGEEMAKAREVWTGFLEIQPEDARAKAEIERLAGEGRRRVEAYLKEASLLEAKGDVGEAALVTRNALRVEPESVEARRAEEEMRRRKDDLLGTWADQAKRALREDRGGAARDWALKILKVEPDHPEAKRWLAEAAERQTNRIGEWLRAAQAADIRFQPQEALKALGALLAAQPEHPAGGELQKRIRERLASAERHRAETEEAKLKGDIAYGQGQLAEAIGHWEKALEWDYYNTDIRGKVDGAKKELKRP